MEVNRTLLLDSLNLVAPGLASKDFIPLLTHFYFHDGLVLAFNDLVAIETNTEIKDKFSVRGDLLLGLLKESTGETVSLDFITDENIIRLKAGRSKADLNMISDPYPFSFPEIQQDSDLFEGTDEIVKGLETCFISTVDDPTKLIMTCVVYDKGWLYSTDNITFSAFKVEDLGYKTQLFFPRMFITHLLNLYKKVPEKDRAVAIFPIENSFTAQFAVPGRTVYFHSKTPIVDPYPYAEVLAAHHEGTRYSPVPKGLEQALKRALIVCGGMPDQFVAANVEDGNLSLTAKSKLGKLNEELVLAGDPPPRQIQFRPDLLLRALPFVDEISFGPKALLARKGEQFVYMMSYV